MRTSFRLLQQHVSRANTIGFIGLGAMGREMCSNLVVKSQNVSKGISKPTIAIHDAVDQSITRFLTTHKSTDPNLNIVPATSPASIARLAGTIVTVLPSSPEVKDVYLDPDNGILSALKSLSPSDASSTLLIDCTTLDQAVAKEVSAQICDTGAQMIDAPVSGGVVGARDATLSFMCGGDNQSFQKATPFLDLMGKRAVYCGPSGNGLAAKIANNLVLAITMLGTAEAMLLGTRLGLTPDLLASILNISAGRSWSSEVNNPHPGALPGKGTPADRGYTGGFLSKLMAKDLELAISAANETDLKLPSGTLAATVYRKLRDDPTFSDRDFSVVFEWLEEGNKKKET